MRRRFLKQGALSLPSMALLGPLLSSCASMRTSGTKAREVSSRLDLETYAPGSPEYEKLLLGNNASHKSIQPHLLALPKSEEEVIQTLAWARCETLPIHLRGGGHCFEDLSTSTGLRIDLRRMDRIEINAATRRVLVGAGTRTGALNQALGPHGLLIPTGSCSQVGIAGLTLGGGYGFSSRKLGLTCDSLREIRLVDARGKIWRASERENPELFWAHRGGGGGNFWAVTQFEFEAHLCSKLSVLSAQVPADKTRELFTLWQSGKVDAPFESVFFKSKSHYFNKTLTSEKWDAAFRLLNTPLAGSLGIIVDPYRGAISGLTDDQTAYSGGNLSRLEAIKRSIDPEDFFHHSLGLESS